MTLNASDRERFAQLADVLIPAADGKLSASQADVAGRWLDAVLAARPDLAAGLEDVLKQAGDGEPSQAIADLQRDAPAAFEVLAEVVPGAYFMNPDVQQTIGYEGQVAREIDPRPDYMEDGLLESVIRRGPVYRPTEG